MDSTYSTGAEEPSGFLHTFDYNNVAQDWLFDNNQSIPYYDEQTPIASEQSDLSWPTNASDSNVLQQGLSSHNVYPIDERGAPSTNDMDWAGATATSTADQLSTQWALTPDFNHPEMQLSSHLGNFSLPTPAKSRTNVRKGPHTEARLKVPVSRSRLSHEARLILNQWFNSHRNDPYLEKNEAEDLARATDLTVRQVRTYFANARARKLPPTPATISSGREPSPVQKEENKDGADNGQCGQCKDESANDWAAEGQSPPTPKDQSPMERFLSDSPSNDAVPEDLIRAAAENLSSRRSSLTKHTRTRKNRYRRAQNADTPNLSSRAPSVCSATSNKSAARGPRRGRKRLPENLRLPQTVAITRAPADSRKLYQCTFCTQAFAHKYDWRRHEESVHCPQQEWICMPDHTPVVPTLSGTPHCAFCNEANPTESHLETHNCNSCLSAPRSHRVFTRKDKLLQHISQVHKQSATPQHLAKWCRPIERNVTYWCGICGLKMCSWQERVDHIASHFLQGQDMRFWQGEAGHVHAGPADDAVSPFTTPPQPATAEIGTQGFPFSAAPSPALSASALPYACSVGCGLRFPHFDAVIFHERQSHGIYKQRPDITAEMLAPALNTPAIMSIPPTPIVPSTYNDFTAHGNTNANDFANATPWPSPRLDFITPSYTPTWPPPGTLDPDFLPAASFDRRMTAPADMGGVPMVAMGSEGSFDGSGGWSASCSPEMARFASVPVEGGSFFLN